MSLAAGQEDHDPHADALELLERALAYTRVALAGVGPERDVPTPCAAWSLADLLAHMDDGLDAFLEAAQGAVHLPVDAPDSEVGHDLALIVRKACHLLGVWSTPTPAWVVVGDRPVPVGLLVRAAALEIAVHGWDVGQATGRGRALPEDLARHLLPVARGLVTAEDRPGRFAPPLARVEDVGHAGALLAFLGRRGRKSRHFSDKFRPTTPQEP